MAFGLILVSKALPDGTFSQKVVIDAHRTITSSNDLRDFTAGTVRSSKGKFDACVYTHENVCPEAASSNGLRGSQRRGSRQFVKPEAIPRRTSGLLGLQKKELAPHSRNT